jgi:hypothetical protein
MDNSLARNIDDNVKNIANKMDDYFLKKGSISLIFSSNTSDWTTPIYPPIILDDPKNYEVALIDLETYYSFPNIDSKNNQFKYFNGSTSKTITQ